MDGAAARLCFQARWTPPRRKSIGGLPVRSSSTIKRFSDGEVATWCADNDSVRKHIPWYLIFHDDWAAHVQRCAPRPSNNRLRNLALFDLNDSNMTMAYPSERHWSEDTLLIKVLSRLLSDDVQYILYRFFAYLVFSLVDSVFFQLCAFSCVFSFLSTLHDFSPLLSFTSRFCFSSCHFFFRVVPSVSAGTRTTHVSDPYVRWFRILLFSWGARFPSVIVTCVRSTTTP